MEWGKELKTPEILTARGLFKHGYMTTQDEIHLMMNISFEKQGKTVHLLSNSRLCVPL